MSSAPGDEAALRWLGGLALASSAATIYYGYRLLRLFRCRGASLLLGTALLLVLPCLFISAYGARGRHRPHRPRQRVRVLPHARSCGSGVLRAFRRPPDRRPGRPGRRNEVSGLVALATLSCVLAARLWSGPHRLALARNGAAAVALCALLGGWKYADNVRRYGTPMFANGSAASGFTLRRRETFRDRYEFTTLRFRDLMSAVSPGAGAAPLADLPVYRSVPTALHGLAWSDLSFFSDPSRHGDPTHPYPRKRMFPLLTRAVLVLAFVPEALAVTGLLVGLRRRAFWPMTLMTVLGVAAYLWWLPSQPTWGIKAKYPAVPGPAVHDVRGDGDGVVVAPGARGRRARRGGAACRAHRPRARVPPRLFGRMMAMEVDTAHWFPALRSRNFLLLWIGLGVSFAGSFMQQAALLWHVSLLVPPERKGLALGMVGLVRVGADRRVLDAERRRGRRLRSPKADADHAVGRHDGRGGSGVSGVRRPPCRVADLPAGGPGRGGGRIRPAGAACAGADARAARPPAECAQPQHGHRPDGVGDRSGRRRPGHRDEQRRVGLRVQRGVVPVRGRGVDPDARRARHRPGCRARGRRVVVRRGKGGPALRLPRRR